MACDLLQSIRHQKLGVENGPARAGEVLTSVLCSTVTRDKERAEQGRLPAIARLLYHVWWRPALSTLERTV
jgi:hypothetical protein